MPDWVQVFNNLYKVRTSRNIAFQKAILSAGQVAYNQDVTLAAGIRYRDVGFDPIRGVLYTEARVEVLIWLRDWFSRTTDGATATELQQLATDMKGDVKEGTREHYSRFVIDGTSLKYERHALDERPDGVIFAVIVTLQAA